MYRNSDRINASQVHLPCSINHGDTDRRAGIDLKAQIQYTHDNLVRTLAQMEHEARSFHREMQDAVRNVEDSRTYGKPEKVEDHVKTIQNYIQQLQKGLVQYSAEYTQLATFIVLSDEMED